MGRILVLILALGICAGAGDTSKLWGTNGEAWSPESRLPDFSFAGYERGEKKLPTYEVTSNVRDFGAKGDGQTDDSAAFQKAFDEAPEGAILVPGGRYVITKPLTLSRSNIVLRGRGYDKTVLFFPKPLNEVRPSWSQTTTGLRTSQYSWSGGFIRIQGEREERARGERREQFEGRSLAVVSQGALRGGRVLKVKSADKLKVGQELVIRQRDARDNSLAAHLYSGDSGPVDKLRGRMRTLQVARITNIKGSLVAFDRTFRQDIELRWRPELLTFEPKVQRSGIEFLAFEFPVTPYGGHFKEEGYNPVTFSEVAHCWLKHIWVSNADSGPFIDGFFNTIDGIVLDSKRGLDKTDCSGHHGISYEGGDNLCINFDFRTKFIHDFTLTRAASGNVICDGKGVDLSLDHHKKAPYENLFTNLDAGVGSRLWMSGGGSGLGKHCGARTTFWKISAEMDIPYFPPNFGPDSINLVGLTTSETERLEKEGKWIEVIPPQSLEPQNLYRAQLAKRLSRRR